MSGDRFNEYCEALLVRYTAGIHRLSRVVSKICVDSSDRKATMSCRPCSAVPSGEAPT